MARLPEPSEGLTAALVAALALGGLAVLVLGGLACMVLDALLALVHMVLGP